jgi:hypothetical protein
MRSRVRFPVLPWGFFIEGEDSHGDHDVDSLAELTFKAPLKGHVVGEGGIHVMEPSYEIKRKK